VAAINLQSSNHEQMREPARAQSRAAHPSKAEREDMTAFLESLTRAVDSGNLLATRQLTTADMMDYAKRNYHNPRTAELLTADSE